MVTDADPPHPPLIMGAKQSGPHPPLLQKRQYFFIPYLLRYVFTPPRLLSRRV
jgi:hypothetical protein